MLGEINAWFPALVEELLHARVDLIVTGGPASQAAPLAAMSVPVVFGFSGDPVDAGIVASFARPGGNATGVSFLALDLSVKRIDLLKEAMPTMTRVAVLSNPDHAGDASELKATRETAVALGLAIEHFEVRTDDGFEPAFAAIAQSKCDGLLAFPDAIANFNRQKIVAFTLRHRLPSIYGWKMYAEAGGLMSYGPVLYDALRGSGCTWTKSSKGRSRPIYRSSSRRSWRWSSTSKRREPLEIFFAVQ